MFDSLLFRKELYLAARNLTGTWVEEGFIIDNGRAYHLRGVHKAIPASAHDGIPHSGQQVFTHFHPYRQPLSRNGISWLDVLFSSIVNHSEIRAVYPWGVWRIKRPIAGWDSVQYYDKMQESYRSPKTERSRFIEWSNTLNNPLALEFVPFGFK